MIEKNLSTAERLVRLILGALLAIATAAQPELGGFEWFTAILALFLVLNGLFSRCYLWHLLDISSCGCNRVPSRRYCNNTSV